MFLHFFIPIFLKINYQNHKRYIFSIIKYLSEEVEKAKINWFITDLIDIAKTKANYVTFLNYCEIKY